MAELTAAGTRARPLLRPHPAQQRARPPLRRRVEPPLLDARPDDARNPLPALRASRPTPRSQPTRSSAWESSTRSRSTSTTRSGTTTAARAGRRSSSGDKAARCAGRTTARASTERPRRRSRRSFALGDISADLPRADGAAAADRRAGCAGPRADRRGLPRRLPRGALEPGAGRLADGDRLRRGRGLGGRRRRGHDRGRGRRRAQPRTSSSRPPAWRSSRAPGHTSRTASSSTCPTACASGRSASRRACSEVRDRHRARRGARPRGPRGQPLGRVRRRDRGHRDRRAERHRRGRALALRSSSRPTARRLEFEDFASSVDNGGAPSDGAAGAHVGGREALRLRTARARSTNAQHQARELDHPARRRPGRLQRDRHRDAAGARRALRRRDRATETSRPIALAAEREELGITAGLGDRVVQVYGGLVYLDLAREGGPRVEPLDASRLPDLFVAWRPDAATDSGDVHSEMRERFKAGEHGGRRARCGRSRASRGPR